MAGTARINGDQFGAERSACAVLSYDYTVLAGTQGYLGHRKDDRLFELIERMRLPTVFFAEGGGGRPGTPTSRRCRRSRRARSSCGRSCRGGAAHRDRGGRCFAGNAVIAGSSDLIVATADASIGMGGRPIAAAASATFPDEVGPIAAQAPNGVIDVVAADEAEAVAATKRLLAYFQGRRPGATAATRPPCAQ